ncbi:MAG: hypothetical protein ACMXYA_02770 [Candidatus Woesearchaeota archaeon]
MIGYVRKEFVGKDPKQILRNFRLNMKEHGLSYYSQSTMRYPHILRDFKIGVQVFSYNDSGFLQLQPFSHDDEEHSYRLLSEIVDEITSDCTVSSVHLPRSEVKNFKEKFPHLHEISELPKELILHERSFGTTSYFVKDGLGVFSHSKEHSDIHRQILYAYSQLGK